MKNIIFLSFLVLLFTGCDGLEVTEYEEERRSNSSQETSAKKEEEDQTPEENHKESLKIFGDGEMQGFSLNDDEVPSGTTHKGEHHTYEKTPIGWYREDLVDDVYDRLNNKD